MPESQAFAYHNGISVQNNIGIDVGSDARILMLAIAGIIIGAGLFFHGFTLLKRRQMIQNTPTSKIRSIAMGPVEVHGKAMPSEKKVMESPFSGKECVWYRYTVEEYRTTGKNHYWATVKNGDSGVPFFVKDETGSVLVNPKEAEVDIPMDYECDSGFGKDPPARVRKFLKSNAAGFEGLFGINSTMRYREYFITPGDKLYVMGTAGDNPYVEEGTGKKNEEDIMIQKGKNFFYISDKPEKDVVSSMAWKAVGSTVGGAALAVGGLAITLLYIGLL